jgi:hypothetical protein
LLRKTEAILRSGRRSFLGLTRLPHVDFPRVLRLADRFEGKFQLSIVQHTDANIPVFRPVGQIPRGKTSEKKSSNKDLDRDKIKYHFHFCVKAGERGRVTV